MRVLIACDMEGISGVVHWDQVDPKHAEYQRFQAIMTDEVNAAIDGAIDGGATAVTVTDGHNNGRNILIERLHLPARLISGSPAPLSMVQGAAEVDVAFFIGYHAKANTAEAILCHTWTDDVRHVWLNNREVGEIGLNAAVCGSFNVPIGLITGDEAATAEARDLIGPLETVGEKRALGRMSAECYPIEENQRAIRLAAAHAMIHQPAPFKVEAPITLRVELTYPHLVDEALNVPGTRRVDGTTVEWIGADMVTTYNAFRAIVA
jgi:D-amino peptidase